MLSRRFSVASAGVGLLAALASCTFDTRNDLGADASPIDATADAAVESDAALAPVHLLLSEIKTSNDQRLREFVEIYNPTAATIDLRTYYIADNALYARLPAIAAGEAAVLASGDFIVRFPEGATISPAGVVVVALRSSAARPFLEATFAVSPSDATPPMIAAFPGAVAGVPELDNDDGEGIALFRWDGESDLVTDIDLFKAGYNISVENALGSKTGVAVDGPDGDLEVSTYKGDADTMPLPIRSNGTSESFVRVGIESAEISSGGNGMLGHDETSENIRESWGFALENPGQVSLPY